VGWWRWALVRPDGVAPSRMVGVSASVNLPLHHKVQKFSSGTGSPGWSRKKGRKTVVVWWWYVKPAICTRPESIKQLSFVFTDKYALDLIPIMSHMNDYLQRSQVYYNIYYKYYHNHSLNITWRKFSKQSSQTD